jgi:PhnB protein
MQTSVYLFFDGTCEEALTFYAKTLGAKIGAMLTYKSGPPMDNMPADFGKKIMHANLIVGDTHVMASDAPPGRYNKPQGFDVALGTDSNEDAERIFAALSDGGNVTMPMQETFFAHRFGSVTDRFGIPWMVLHGKETVPGN